MPSNFLMTIIHNKIKQAYENADSVKSISHNTVKGTFREGFLVPIIQSLLPPHFGIGSGQIIDKWDRFSPQADIIIYDKRKIPPVLEQNGLGVYFIDSVHRVIEVKSDLDTKGVQQTLDLAWALHPDNEEGLKTAKDGKLEGEKNYYPLVSCFSYNQSITDLNSALSKWENPGAISNVLFCLPKTGLYNFIKSEGEFNRIPTGTDRVENTALYLALYLTFLEEEAESRADFSLSEWMLS